MSPTYRAQLEGTSPSEGEPGVKLEPTSKKRKIDVSQTSAQYPDSDKKPSTSTSYVRNESTEHLLFSAEASFAVPVRKKLSVSFYQSAKDGPGHGGLDIAAGDVRFGFHWGDIGTLERTHGF